jgi:hypothetical protein
MRFGSINRLRCKQFKLVILAFFVVFLLCKWEKGTYYGTEVLQPDSLVLTQPDHLEDTKLSLLLFFWVPNLSLLYSNFHCNLNS